MKHLKTINELFDTEELKSEMEIDYLSGNLNKKDMVTKDFYKSKDILLSKLSINSPYINKLYYKKISEQLMQIGFNHHLTYKGDNIDMYFTIEISKHSIKDNYLCNVYAKCLRGSKLVFDKRANLKIATYKELYEFINGEALNILLDLSDFTEKYYNYRYFEPKNRDEVGGIEGPISNN